MHRSAMGAKDWTLLLLLSAIWGSSFFFYKVLVTAVPPMTVVFGRMAIAAAALLLVAVRNWSPLSRKTWGELFFLALVANVLPFALIAWAETRITTGLASILNASTPIFTVLVANVMTRDERLTWNRGLGVVICFIGVAVLVGPAAFGGQGLGGLVGELASLAAALLYGVSIVYGRRFKAISPLQLSTAQFLAAAAISLPLMLVLDRPWSLPFPSLETWGAFAGLGLLCTAFAYILYFRILQSSGATNVSLVTILNPVSAIFLGAVLLGERLEPRSLGGFLLIAAGLVALDGRLLRRLSSPRQPDA